MPEKTIVTADVEVHYSAGKKTIKMILKNPDDIQNCPEGKTVVINLRNGETYAGFFRGFDDSTIMLKSTMSGGVIGLELPWIVNYFEEE